MHLENKMTLGVYWYFDFPNGLYSYDFFKFRKGLGGHADAPAELLADVKVENGELLIAELTELVESNTDAFIFAYKLDNHLRIGIGGYMMYDFEFELALKVENILKSNNAQPNFEANLVDVKLIRLTNKNENKASGPNKNFLQIVGSPLKKYNAETASIRFDCNISIKEKKDFFYEIKSLTDLANIDVVYYLDKACGKRTNLMLFFTNGRQGIGLSPKQKIDIKLFEEGLDILIERFNIEIGHISGFGNYPSGKSKLLKIVDQEFII